MKWLLISTAEAAVYDEDELKMLLPDVHVRCRLYRLNGLNDSPREFYIRDGYVEDLWGHLEFNFGKDDV